MPEAGGVAISADGFVAVVSAYADRVHDGVRREGCTPLEAVQIVETSAADLLDRLVRRRGSVTDVVGTWFRDARVLATRVAAGRDRDADPIEQSDAPTGVVRDAEDDLVARDALAALSDRDRHTLLLRDAYDLPYQSTAVALGVDAATAAVLVAQARLRFLKETGATVSASAAHNRDIVRTSRLADGSLGGSEALSAREHLRRCTICGPLEPAFTDARRLLSGLAIVALPDTERDVLLTRIRTMATRLLPSADRLAATVAAGAATDVRPPRPGVVVACLAGALVMGSLAGLVTAGGGGGRRAVFFGGDDPSPTQTQAVSTPSATAESVEPSAGVTQPTGTTPPSGLPSRSPSTSPPAEPTATTSPTQSPASITVTPASGPNCRDVRVRGRDWPAGVAVVVTYRGLTGQELTRAEDVTGTDGRFSVVLPACDPSQLPGPHEVRARGGGVTARATYTATA